MKIHIATSGWSYKHWYGLFYPQELKPVKFLEHYIKFFDCTELNSSFYHMPKLKTIENWYERTPDNFKFAIKLSRTITHYHKLENIDDSLIIFLNNFELLKEKLGPILIQLPPGLKYDKGLIENFLKLLKKYGPNYRYAIEVRNQTWMNEEFYGILRKNNISLVISHSNNRFPYTEEITADFVYIRLHGPSTLYSSEYSSETLDYYCEKIIEWSRDKEVWVFFNNDFNGYAIKNGFMFKEMLRKYNENN